MKSPHTLIVSDVHLMPQIEHPINQAFQHFLTHEAPKAEALYILGDLFELWLGDDIGLTQYAKFIQIFKQLTQQGLPIYLLYGNRDFLMQNKFWQATGIHPLNDIQVITLYHTPYLILHGDTLCTHDHGYQIMRRLLRNKLITKLFLSLPKQKRLSIGQSMRQKSKQSSQNKPLNLMDVNPQTVLSLFKKYPTLQHMIHGHTHRPQHHILKIPHRTLHRWVLSDWKNTPPYAQIIKISSLGPKLINYPVN